MSIGQALYNIGHGDDNYTFAVRLRNGDMVEPSFQAAGTAGWNVDVWLAFDDNDDAMYWEFCGTTMDHEDDGYASEYDMVEVVITG